MKPKKRILVAPLNWGLGHATRCIPIINALLEHNFEPIIASDGNALALLKKEFQNLEFINLPSYEIEYAKKGYFLKLKLLKNAPKIINAIKAEKALIKTIIKTHKIDGIISDNRFGVVSEKIPSVFITHQLRVLSGNTTWLSTKLHKKIISQFDECWVPDHKGEDNLSGRLGHDDELKIPTTYIGPISRFKKKDVECVYEIMVLLSGPEPQRQLLEDKLLKEFKTHNGNILFVRGVVEANFIQQQIGKLTLCNYLTSPELEDALNKSKILISRPGYTTIMDLAKLEKKAYFIPTPGQFEQTYLAKKLAKEKIAPSCKQGDFTLNKLDELDDFKGFSNLECLINYKRLFSVFQV